jgi:hypothetical protein
MRDTLSRSLSRLFSDVRLFFKINGVERVVFKDRRCADDVPWEHVKLLFARRSKAKCPYL